MNPYNSKGIKMRKFWMTDTIANKIYCLRHDTDTREFYA